jgi:hypothetical protein
LCQNITSISPPSAPPLCQVKRQKSSSITLKKWKIKIKNRNERKRKEKMATLADQMAVSAATIKALEAELASIPEPGPASSPAPPPAKSYQFVPKLPMTRSWKEEADLKDMVLR